MTEGERGEGAGNVERLLREAAPHELFEKVRGVLARDHGAAGAELLMADYASARLQPVTAQPFTADSVSAYNSSEGRAFGAQEPHVVSEEGGTTVHLPVSVRGDRLGVLSVRYPAGVRVGGLLGPLQDVADALAHEILVADRDTDFFLQARRARRLTLAAEMQWELLPGRSCSRPEYDLGAQLEPAYAIHGDSFDWSASADHLTLTVNNGMGEGIDAALLTSLAVSALRNARRAGLGLADQAALADQALYGQYQGRLHLAMLLLRFDLDTGEVEVIDAGSPRVWRLRGGTLEPFALEAQLPLGMFEDTVYTCQRFRMLPGDRLFFLSDGVYDVLSPAGEPYGLHALARAVTNTRLLPPSQVPRALLEELPGYRGGADAADDAMVVCLDWHGRPGTERSGER
ncbi:PP2C family protein-serine/threonine phosphatase [Streptomyces erythrochromogenes]|uniref:PP2C family protein-serine/threonine phosphatase n=1 Tax=Streptomyces erythrochromogenes TaxID=285574 RepID=UPI00224E5F61|nr:PP2C family protein-serine/threonine phosphatase [Streptomyces erythrochromogenes]MCX5588786.1 serine/threonine-protein phosphatase [Streptomyces erythrochromogenes]